MVAPNSIRLSKEPKLEDNTDLLLKSGGYIELVTKMERDNKELEYMKMQEDQSKKAPRPRKTICGSMIPDQLIAGIRGPKLTS
jgi:hypothetical protein